jgi:diguanylate cyclase (GGDEF)-like protein/PAS domain S-box-containing protein
VNRVLLIELSATLRHAARKIMENHGYQVDDVPSFAAGLARVREASANSPYDALAIGWPAKTDQAADELFTILGEDPEYRNLNVIVLTHDTDSAKLGWVTKRSNTALVLWENYIEIVDVLASRNKTQSSTASLESMLSQENTAMRVLFVDDSPTVRVNYRRLLIDNGYVTDTACCVEEGMEKALANPYDIAIIDYYMPDGTGDTLCAMIRDNPRTAGITTAIITGTYSDKAIISSLAAGAVECMFKNEVQELFLARVHAMARSIRALRNIRNDNRHLEGILSSVGDGVYGVNCDGLITFINPAAREILGYTEADTLIGQPAHRMFHPEYEDGSPNPIEKCHLQSAYRTGEQFRSWATTFKHADGRHIAVECTVYPLVVDSVLTGSVVAFRDVSERKLLLEELKWQATHDPLTKLPNRSYFETELVQEVKRLRRSKEVSALLYIDLDRFKYINDTAGHDSGDKLLIAAGNQLRSRLRASDTLARIGGDEFAVIMRNIETQHAFEAADTFREVLDHSQFNYAGKQYKINASIGVALITGKTSAAGEVLSNADIACYIAKGKGRNHTHVFESNNYDKAAMDIELGWSARLHDALKQDQFALHFQPIVPLEELRIDDLPQHDGQLWEKYFNAPQRTVLRYEVLLRMIDSRGKYITPDAFLPTAERFNMMAQIDRWVIKNAVQTLANAKTSGREIRLSINLAGQTLESKGLAEFIHNIVQEQGVDPAALMFEITETTAIANLDAANNFVSQMKDRGYSFALDDFGSGFCSFSHLKFLAVDEIKIDGIFIQGMLYDKVDRAIVRSIVQIAHSLGKRTVAEFVENVDVVKLLKSSGIDYVQGYYISRPRLELRDAQTQKPDSTSQAG